MSNRVYTYTGMNELVQAPFFSGIAAIPQITMSREMAAAMTSSMRVFRNHTAGFSSFLQRLFPGWNTAGQRFRFLMIANAFLREKWEAADSEAESRWLSGCKKNLPSAVANMIRLEEAQIRPEDLNAGDKNILLFRALWKRLEEEDASIGQFRARQQALKSPEAFDAAVQQIFRFHGRKQIVFHGFPYFTPIQQFVFDCFCGAGYEVLALFQYDLRYPYACEIWRSMYAGKNGFPPENEWICQEAPVRKNALGEIFERGEKTQAGALRLIRYEDTTDFVSDIPRIREEGYHIYSADDISANALLKNYFPEQYEARNLLAYPIGQFIYLLHRLWKEEAGQILLEADDLRRCFASGWLSAGGRSSLRYTEDLERLLPFFEACRTLPEWEVQIRKLEEVYEMMENVWGMERTGDPETDAVRVRMGEPLRWFDVFSVPADRLSDVLALIRKLIETAGQLFPGKKAVSLREHMSRLDALLNVNEAVTPDLYLEERDKVRQIFAVLENSQMQDLRCYPEDIAAALISLMNAQEEEAENAKNELRTLVFHLFQIESAPVQANGKVHICLAEMGALPGRGEEITWPLTEEMLSDIAKRREHPYLRVWLESRNCEALANRYYCFTALGQEAVEISWVYRQGEKVHSPSPYVTLLSEFTGTEVEKKRSTAETDIVRILPRQKKDTYYEIGKGHRLRMIDGKLDYAVCPMRYVYGYVLSESPVYRGTYQQNRAVRQLICSLAELLKPEYTLAQTAEQVFKLFPQIRKAEKRQILDEAEQYRADPSLNGVTQAAGFFFTDQRLNLEFSDPRVYENARRQAETFMNREEKCGLYYERMGEQNTGSCIFCPHESYCMESLFGIDYKGSYDD